MRKRNANAAATATALAANDSRRPTAARFGHPDGGRSLAAEGPAGGLARRQVPNVANRHTVAQFRLRPIQKSQFLIATPIIRNRPNSSEISDFDFSTRNKNSYFASVFPRRQAAMPRTREAENAQFLIDSAPQLEIAATGTKQRAAHVSNR
jgi:hypothetical protein